MNPTRRERIREATYGEIKSVAWGQIAEHGVPALSLRAIAREMGMTAPGLYRYYSSRDELVTALIIEAFESFSLYLETARDALPASEYTNRYLAVCTAYFQWGVENPARYTLIFGSPVPGYTMGPAAYPAAQRGFLVLQGVIGEAQAAGRLHPPENAIPLEAALLGHYTSLQQLGMPYTAQVTHLALITWSMMHGITALFVYGYLSGFLAEQVPAYANQAVRQMAQALGFI